METAFEVLQRAFADQGWPVTLMDGQSVLTTVFQGEHGRYDCLAGLREAEDRFLFYAVCPIRAPVERRVAACEFIARANYDMVMGNFELDLDDGEIRYKTSSPIQGPLFTSDLVTQLVVIACRTMDEYMPGLLAVTHGTTQPLEAIHLVEGPATDEEAG